MTRPGSSPGDLAAMRARTEAAERIVAERISWDARCQWCGGPSYPWLTGDETWAKVEPILGQQQACFECFSAAWFALGHNDGEPFHVTRSDVPALLALVEEMRPDAETRDYLTRTIATIRNHRDADNCWPQWANALADEIERLWSRLSPEEPAP